MRGVRRPRPPGVHGLRGKGQCARARTRHREAHDPLRSEGNYRWRLAARCYWRANARRATRCGSSFGSPSALENIMEALSRTEFDKRRSRPLLGSALASLYRKLGERPDRPIRLPGLRKLPAVFLFFRTIGASRWSAVVHRSFFKIYRSARPRHEKCYMFLPVAPVFLGEAEEKVRSVRAIWRYTGLAGGSFCGFVECASLVFSSPHELRRRRSSHLAIKKGGVDVSFKQSIETSGIRKAQNAAGTPGDVRDLPTGQITRRDLFKWG